jgi:acetyl-CoA carboxylase biotin carboxylase subunit
LFRKVLIANRGEIALRIIRACQELDIRTVAIYSEADADSLHVAYADEAYCVGPAPSSQSYLNIPNIISAALISGADAIHPGYGYLAERAHFAEICRANGLAFIGPSPETIERMGDKAAAKRTMEEAGVPVIPGSPGGVESDREAAGIAREIGYPVIVKAAAGGGGKGMRVAYDEKELLRVLAPARAESEAAFGSGVVYLEKFVTKPRHVEIQLLVDSSRQGHPSGRTGVFTAAPPPKTPGRSSLPHHDR